MYSLTRMRCHRNRPRPQAQRGITLIETLCAIVIMAVGILGIIGVQLRTLTDTQTTVRRAQAIRMIEDLGERMKVNPNGVINMDRYVLGWSTGSAIPMTAQASTQCDAQSCDSAELAAYDIREWKRLVEKTLPGGNASTFVPLAEQGTSQSTPPNRRQLGVLIRWRENVRDGADAAYSQAIDTGVSRTADGGQLTISPEACPQGFTCHLQYIPVSGRCTPDLRGGNDAPQFFCSGV